MVYCPVCNEASLKKLVSAAAFRLKGTGWYETDFKNNDKKKEGSTKGSSSEKGKDSAKSTDGDKSSKGGSGSSGGKSGASASAA